MLRRFAALLLSSVVLILGLSTPAHAADPSNGADYSWYRPSLGQLDAANIGFVARYLVPQAWGSGKALTVYEARQLIASGRVILLNYEWNAGSARGGYTAGVRDAQNAEVARREVGAPPDSVIYFSIDYDERDPSVVVDYLNGVASVIGKPRTGVYGGYYVVQAAENAGFGWSWQTYAWSGGRWDPRANVHQWSNGSLWGGEGDRDARIAEFGGWSSLARDDGNGDLTPGPVVQINPAPAPPTSSSVYYVRAGDTLSRIAATHGTTWQTLAAINHLANPNLIYVGERLVLAGSAPAQPLPAPPAPADVYYVVAGDTLSGIGRRYGVSWQTLAAINHLPDPNRIYVGQRLVISGGGPVAPTGYTVHAGDTLSRIAATHGTTWQHLQQINHLGNPNLIYPGETLRLS